MRQPERAIATAFVLVALAGAGFATVYSLGGQVQLEGALLGLAFAALAYGLAAWAKHLTPQGPFVEEHEAFEPTRRERAAFEDELERDTRALGRRRLLGRTLGLALGVLGAALLFPLRSLGVPPDARLRRTPWQAGIALVTPEGQPVRADELPVGSVLTVFPQGHTEAADAVVILVRLDPAHGGLVAHSKLCTHAGCPVGLFEQATSRLFCPCHQSVFDLLDGARPTAGPATRPLPALPVTIGEDGVLRAGGELSAPPGPGWWRLPAGDDGSASGRP